MKTPSLFRFSSILGLGVLTLSALCTAKAADDSSLRLILSVDLTAAGKELTPPTPEKPVYYISVVDGYRELGGLDDDAAPYEKKVPVTTVMQPVIKALAAQGYLSASKEFPPSIVLTFQWGSIAPQILTEPDIPHVKMNGGMPMHTPPPPSVTANIDEMHTYLLGDKTNAIIMGQKQGANQQMLLQSRQASHFLIITALDLADYNNHHYKKTVLWRARVSSTAYGNYLKDVVAQYIAALAPRLGKETDPGITTTQVTPDGHVIVGEPVMIEGTSAQDTNK